MGNIFNGGLAVQQGDWIYYLNDFDYRKIYRIRYIGNGRNSVNDDRSYYPNVVDNWIYYSNVDDDWKIYKICINGSRCSRFNSDSSFWLSAVGDWIYYNILDGLIHKIRTDVASAR